MVVASFLAGSVFIGGSIYNLGKHSYAYDVLRDGPSPSTGVELVESLNHFLVAVPFFIFSFGVAQVFIPDSRLKRNLDIPSFKISTLKELKTTLWGTVLLTLTISFASEMILLKGPGE